jgi:hypothetical protein
MRLVVPYGSFSTEEQLSAAGLSEASVHQHLAELTGFQLNVVEQWLINRQQPFYKWILLYTGDPGHHVDITVYDTMKNSSLSEDNAITLLNQYEKDELRPFETSHGVVYIAILANLPPVLDLIPLPDGSVTGISWHLLVANFNLKRIGCMPRTALLQPTPITTHGSAIIEKLQHTWHLNNAFQISGLILFIQVALFLFGDFSQPNWIDGILCNETLDALLLFCEKQSKISGERKRALFLPTGNMMGPTKTTSSGTSLLPQNTSQRSHKRTTSSSFWAEKAGSDLPLIHQGFAGTLSLLYSCKNRLVRILGNDMVSLKLDPLLCPLEFMADLANFQQEYGLRASSKLDLPTIELLDDLVIFKKRSMRGFFKSTPKAEDFPINLETNEWSQVWGFNMASISILHSIDQELVSKFVYPKFVSVYSASSIHKSIPNYTSLLSRKHSLPKISIDISKSASVSEPTSPKSQTSEIIPYSEHYTPPAKQEKKGGLKKAFKRFFDDRTSTSDEIISDTSSAFTPYRQPSLYGSTRTIKNAASFGKRVTEAPVSSQPTSFSEQRLRSNSTCSWAFSNSCADGYASKPRRWSMSSAEGLIFPTPVELFHDLSIPFISIDTSQRSKAHWVESNIEDTQKWMNYLLEQLTLLDQAHATLKQSNESYEQNLDHCQSLHDQITVQLQQLMNNTSKIRYDSSQYQEKQRELQENLKSLQKDISDMEQHYPTLEEHNPHK